MTIAGAGGEGLATPRAAIALFETLLVDRPIECVAAAYLGADYRPLRIDIVAEGDAAAADLPIPHILKSALAADAGRLIVAHNHPGGDPTPSGRDRVATRRLAAAALALDILLVDHVVVARDGAFSFRLHGLL